MLDIVTTTDTFLDDLNEAVKILPSLARVRFESGLRADAYKWIDKKHAEGQVHEPATLAAFLAARKRFPHIKTIYDIGALFGYFLLWAGSLWEEAQVTAFEMHPGAIPSLCHNVWPGTRVVHAAISDRTEAGVLVWLSAFNIYEKPQAGWQDLPNIPGAMKQRGDANAGRGYARTDFVTLDDYCAATGDKPSLIKIDVEAYQTKAVRGALGIIAEHRPILIVELHET